MELVLDRCSVVLAGAWNMAIFTPTWVGRRLFPKEPELLIEAAFLPIPVARFIAPGFQLVVTPTQVDLRPTRTDDDMFNAVEATARMLLEQLPETPVRAFGINFGFRLTEPCPALAPLLEPEDAPRLRAFGAATDAVGLIRQLRFSDVMVNLCVTRTGADLVDLDLNHHVDVATATAARERLAGAVLSARVRSCELLDRVYGLKLGAS